MSEETQRKFRQALTFDDVLLVPGERADLSLSGSGPTGVAGLRALILAEGLLLGVAGVDPLTGAWSFAGLAPGAYTVELRLGDTLLERRSAVVGAR